MLSDLGALYREEIESRIAALKPRLGEKGIEEELKSIAQTVSLLESEGRKNRSAMRREELLTAATGLRREIEALTEENKRKQLLAKSAKVGDEEAGGLLDEDEAETLARSSDNLTRSKRNLKEMVEIGTGVQANLSSQMDTIQSARGKMSETNNLTGEARGILRNIENNERRQRLFMYAAVCIVVVAVAGVVYYMLFGS